MSGAPVRHTRESGYPEVWIVLGSGSRYLGLGVARNDGQIIQWISGTLHKSNVEAQLNPSAVPELKKLRKTRR